jgi:hypothetical protein
LKLCDIIASLCSFCVHQIAVVVIHNAWFVATSHIETNVLSMVVYLCLFKVIQVLLIQYALELLYLLGLALLRVDHVHWAYDLIKLVASPCVLGV